MEKTSMRAQKRVIPIENNGQRKYPRILMQQKKCQPIQPNERGKKLTKNYLQTDENAQGKNYWEYEKSFWTHLLTL